MNGYTDGASVTNRANSALLRIESIIQDRFTPASVRLVMVAEIMAQEPILTDSSPAARTARRDADRTG